MRATDCHFRSPSIANPPYTQFGNILDAHSRRNMKFRVDARFKYGSIYEATLNQSPRVGPQSYNCRLKEKPCAVTYQQSYIESITNCPEHNFEIVNGCRVL